MAWSNLQHDLFAWACLNEIPQADAIMRIEGNEPAQVVLLREVYRIRMTRDPCWAEREREIETADIAFNYGAKVSEIFNQPARQGKKEESHERT